MNEVLVDVVAEVVAVFVFSVGATALAALGLLMEQAGIASLTTGQVIVGLWYVYMGGVVLFVAVYLLGYRQVVRRVTVLVGSVESTVG